MKRSGVRMQVILLTVAAATGALHGNRMALAAGGRAGGGVELEAPVHRGAVTIALPKGWTVVQDGGGRILLVARADGTGAPRGAGNGGGAGGATRAGGGPAGQFQANLLITVDPGGDNFDAAHQQEVAAREATGYQAVEKPAAAAHGTLKGTTFGGTFTRGNLKLRSRQYFFNVDGKLYGITFTCLADSWNTLAPQLDASVASFSVKAE